MNAENECHSIDDSTVEKLILKCRECLQYAYCPYSNFAVGSALLCTDGTIYGGCNVENAAYPMAICAERTAMVKAVSEGHRHFRAIAVTTNITDDYCAPCGNCRQFIAEFGNNILVYLVKPDHSYKLTTIEQLLPMAFCADSLSKGIKTVQINE